MAGALVKHDPRRQLPAPRAALLCGARRLQHSIELLDATVADYVSDDRTLPRLTTHNMHSVPSYCSYDSLVQYCSQKVDVRVSHEIF